MGASAFRSLLVAMCCQILHTYAATSTSVDVLVIGGGVSGLAAARTLVDSNAKLSVLVLEGRSRPGGRIHTVSSTQGSPIEFGATWVHGGNNPAHPISSLAKQFGLQTVADNNDDEWWYSNGMDVTDSVPIEDIYEAFYEWMEDQLGRSDKRSILDMFNKYVTTKKLSMTDQQYLRAGIQAVVELEYATSMSKLSAALFDQGSEYSGSDRLLVNGFVGIVNGLIKVGASILNISYGQQVTAVNYTSGGGTVKTRSGDIFSAKYIICTLPLGVMQANTIVWTPPLPAQKVKAISTLNMGVLNKIILVFNNNFWDPESEASWIGRLTSDNSGTPWFEWYSLVATLQKNILIGFNAGDLASTVEKLSNEATRDSAMSALRSIYPRINIPEPLEYYVTRWAQDPYSYGSYSSIRPNATADVYNVMAAPISNRLFFAGEATHGKYPATVHGAYLSGQRDANIILGLMKTGSGK